MNQDQAIDNFLFKQSMERFDMKDRLTDKQMETWKIVKQKLPEKEAAKILGISVYSYRSRIQGLKYKGWVV